MKLYKKLTYVLFLLPLISMMLFADSAVAATYTITNLTNNSSGIYSETHADVSQINDNGQVVWWQLNSSMSAYDVYLYNGATTTNLTNNSSNTQSIVPHQ